VTTLSPDEIESIHREIDGLNSTEQSRAVRALIDGSAEARQQYEQLRVINAALARIDRVASPDTLRPAILKAVAPRAGHAAGLWVSSRRWAPVKLGYAASFVLGIAAVGLVSTVRDATEVTPADQMVGTLAPRPTSVTVDAWKIDGDDLAGNFEMVRRQGQAVVEFTLDSAGPVDVTLTCGSGCRDMRGFMRRAGQETAIRTDGGQLTVATRGLYSAEVMVGDVAAGAATVDVRVTDGSGTTHAGTLRYRGT
jgi:hypothetical protein